MESIAIIVAVGTGLAIFLAAPVFRRLSDHSVAREMRKQGRYQEWDEFVRRVTDGQGTVILNRTNLSGRVWWTPSAVGKEVEAVAIIQRDAIFTVPPVLFRPTQNRMKQLGAVNVVIPMVVVRS